MGRGQADHIGVYRIVTSIHGDWGGDWAVWGGGSYMLTPKASFKFHVAYGPAPTFAAAANISHHIELSYMRWNNNYGYAIMYDGNDNVASLGVRLSSNGQDTFQGLGRRQRAF